MPLSVTAAVVLVGLLLFVLIYRLRRKSQKTYNDSGVTKPVVVSESVLVRKKEENDEEEKEDIEESSLSKCMSPDADNARHQRSLAGPPCINLVNYEQKRRT